MGEGGEGGGLACSGQSSHAWLPLTGGEPDIGKRILLSVFKAQPSRLARLLATGERVDVSGMQGCCRGTWEAH